MEQTLQDSIRRVRRRAVAVKWIFSCGWFLAIVSGCLLVAGCVDFLLRQDDRASRVALTLLLIGAVGLFAARVVLPLLRQRWTDVFLAQKIQKHFPNLKHKLSTAVEFAAATEHPDVESKAMRRAVIHETTSELAHLPLHEIVHYRAATRAAIIAAVSVTVLLAILFFSPIGARIALARLANPFGNTVWPKINDLVFQNTPSHLAAGGIFEAEVIDRNNRLPRAVEIEYRFEEDGQVRTVAEPMKRIDNLMFAQRKNVQNAFAFRAVGGDDRTGWHQLQTVVPPRVEEIVFEVHPPKYTAWPVDQQRQSVWGLEGSEVLLRGSASVPLQEATWVTAEGESITLQIDSNTFWLPADASPGWTLSKTGSASVQLVDQHGIVGGANERFSIRVVPESPPSVQIEKPSGVYRASPDAILPLQVSVKDNLAIRDIALHFQPSDQPDSESRTIELFRGQKITPLADTDLSERSMLEGDHRMVEREWNLAEERWKPGTEITFYASAHDYRGAEGRSTPPHTLQIVGKEELAEEMGLRQQGLLAELARIVTRQKESNQETNDLEIAWAQTGTLSETQMQSLRGIELTEREIRRSIGSSDSGLQKQIAELEADLTYNQIDDAATSSQLKDMRQTLEQVDRQHLAPLQEALRSARKKAQSDHNPTTPEQPTPGRPEDHLAVAADHQHKAIDQLQPLVDRLLKFNQYRRAVGRLAALAERQLQVRNATQQMTESHSGKDIGELAQDERIKLEQTASQQQSINLQTEQMLSQMRQSGQALKTTDPLAASRLESAIEAAKQQKVAHQMREAGEQLEQNRIGQALEQQQAAEEGLATMLDILRGSRQADLGELVEKLRQAEAELETIANNQKQLAEQQSASLEPVARGETLTEGERQQLQDLDRQRNILEQQIRELAKRVENLEAVPSARSMNAAAQKMRDAGTKAGAKDTKGSAEQDHDAGKLLADARRQLETARRNAEIEQLDQQLAKLPQQLEQLLKKQQALLEQTGAWTEKPAAELSRVDKAKIIKLGRDQLTLVTETQPIKDGLKLAEILQYVVVGAAAKMQQAAERLARFQADRSTQDLQMQAIAQLQMILESLDAAVAENQTEPPGGGGEGGQGGEQAQEDQQRSLAEIRLLKLLQQDLNHRSDLLRTEIDATVARGEDPNGLIEQMRQLGHEQTKLAIWTLGILRDEKQQPGAEDDSDAERRAL